MTDTSGEFKEKNHIEHYWVRLKTVRLSDQRHIMKDLLTRRQNPLYNNTMYNRHVCEPI